MPLPNWNNGERKSQLARRGIHVVGDGKRVVESGVNELKRPGLAKPTVSVRAH
jgi:hypothetical protein